MKWIEHTGYPKTKYTVPVYCVVYDDPRNPGRSSQQECCSKKEAIKFFNQQMKFGTAPECYVKYIDKLL